MSSPSSHRHHHSTGLVATAVALILISAQAAVPPSTSPVKKGGDSYGPPWRQDQPVVYSHDALLRRHDGVSTLDAFVGVFARRAIRNLDDVAHHGRRRLGAGDFDELNALFAGTTIALPDAEFNKDLPWPLTSVDVKLTNLRCTDLSLSDMVITTDRRSAQEIDFGVAISGLNLRCTLNWWYDFGWTSSGGATVVSSGNSLATVATFTSVDFDHHAPTESAIKSCGASINIDSLDFNGGSVSATIANWFESSIKSTVASEVEAMACDELSGLGSATLSSALAELSAKMEPYLGAHVPSDALSGQKALVVPAGTRLLDLTDLQGAAGEMVHMAILETDKQLGGTTVDAATGASTLGINSMMRTNLLDADGAYVVPVSQMSMANNGVVYTGHDMLTETTVSIDRVRVLGLDSFTRFDPLNAVGAQTLHSHIEMARLEFVADMTIDMKPSTHDSSVIINPSTPHQVERIAVKVGLKGLNVTTGWLLAIDQDKLDGLRLGSLMTLSNIPPCLLSSLHAANVTQLAVRVDDVETPTLTGFISAGLDRVLSSTAVAAFQMYEAVIKQALPNYFETGFRHMLNDALATYLANATHTACAPPALDAVGPAGSLVDFRELLSAPADGAPHPVYGDAFSTVQRLIQEQLLASDPNSGTPRVNSVLIRPATEAQSGVAGTFLLTAPGEDLLSREVNLKDLGALERLDLRVFDAKVENLDTVSQPLKLLEPRAADPGTVLDNALTMGNATDAASGAPRPLRATTRVAMRLTGEGVEMQNDLEISVEAEALQVLAALALRVDARKLLDLPLKHAVSAQCWLATIPATEESVALLAELAVSFTRVGLSVRCVACTSPDFDALTAALSSEAAAAEVTAFARRLVGVATDMATGEELRGRVRLALREAAARCADPTLAGTEYDTVYAAPAPHAIDQDLTMMGASAAVVVLAVLAFVAVRVGASRRRKAARARLSDDERFAAANAKLRRQQRQMAVHARTRSIFRSGDVVPALARYLMPLVVVANVGLFLSGHLSLGATVDVHAELAGQSLTLEKFFEFSMAKSTLDMWDAGAKELAVALVLFSGLWPYTKQAATLFLWFAPPRWVKPSTRGGALLWLDALGKWSMIDIFVLVLSLVAFRVSVKSPDASSALPLGLYAAELQVVPLWGLYANLLAQLLSQISSHFIIYYHRNIVAAAEQAQDAAERDREQGGVMAAWSSGTIRGSDLRLDPRTAGCDVEAGVGANAGKKKKKMMTTTTKRKRQKDNKNSRNRGTRRGRAATWLDTTGAEAASARRSTTLEELEELEVLVGTKEALRNHVFEVEGRSRQKATVRGVTQAAVVLLGAAVVPLLVYGCVTPSFRLDIWGLLGVAVEAGEAGGASREFSVLSTAELIVAQARTMDYLGYQVGLGVLAGVFVLCALVVPLAQALALVGLWSAPLTLRQQKRAFVGIEVLAAWQYLEVYLIAIMVAVLQLGQISGFMVNSYCDGLTNTFRGAVSLGLIPARDAQCFYVHASIEYAAFVLLAAAGALALLNQFVTRACAAAIEDRAERFRIAATGGDLGRDVIMPAEGSFRWLLVSAPAWCCAVDLLPEAFALLPAAGASSSTRAHDRAQGGDDDGGDLLVGWEVLYEGGDGPAAGAGRVRADRDGDGDDGHRRYYHTRTGRLQSHRPGAPPSHPPPEPRTPRKSLMPALLRRYVMSSHHPPSSAEDESKSAASSSVVTLQGTVVSEDLELGGGGGGRRHSRNVSRGVMAAGWRELYDSKSRRPYYYSDITGVVTWQRPRKRVTSTAAVRLSKPADLELSTAASLESELRRECGHSPISSRPSASCAASPPSRPEAKTRKVAPPLPPQRRAKRKKSVRFRAPTASYDASASSDASSVSSTAVGAVVGRAVVAATAVVAPEEEGPCDHFRQDLAARHFNTCKCGHPKSAHFSRAA